MAETNKSKPASSENLFIGLIIFLGLVIAYVLYSGSTPAVIDLSLQPSVKENFAPEIENLSLDFSIFDRILFKQLKIFGVIPVKPGQTGRDNPFAPF